MSKNRSKELLEVLPIWKIEQDCLISTSGDYTVVYELTLPEIFTMTAEVEMIEGNRYERGDFKDMNEQLCKAINCLPENTILHQQDWFTEETYSVNAHVNNYLDKASERHFNERPYMKHRSFLMLTKTHDTHAEVGSLMTTLIKGRMIPKELIDDKKRNDFFNGVAQFVSIMESNRNYRMRRLLADDLYAPDGPAGLLERYLSLSINDEVVPLTDIFIDGDIMVGNKSVMFYGISDVDNMPDQVFTHNRVAELSGENSTVNVGFSSPVGLMLPINHVYNQYIFKADKGKVYPELEKRANLMQGLSGFGKENQANADQISSYLTSAALSGYAPVRCHFNIMIFTDDKSKLPAYRTLTTAAISRMGMRPRENSTDAAQLFWAGIPGAAADLPTEEKFYTFLPQACCMLNLESNNHDDLTLSGVKVTDRLSGKPMIVDFSDLPMDKNWCTNRNKFILGPSGSGKSFLTNHLLRSYHTNGAHIVVVDVGDSYEGICQMLDGKYLTYTREKPISFNPFFLEGRAKPDIEKKETIKALLLSMWKKEDEKTTRLEETALSYAVNGYFTHLEENESVFPCFNTFFDYLRTDFIDLLKVEKITALHFDYDGFIIVMAPFYKEGEYDYLLNSKTNLDLTNDPFVVFELDNIKDNKILFPVVTIIIMDTFITKMRTLKGVRKIILIEEAWKAIMKPEMAEFIKYLYKTVRKHFGEAWIVTQEVNDIISSPIVQDSIINNADTKILMDQRKYQNKFDAVKKFLALTEKEANMALSLNRNLDPARKYKEFFVSFGGQHSAVYGLEVSRPEYFAFTTEQKEKLAIKALLPAHDYNYDRAIREHVDG